MPSFVSHDQTALHYDVLTDAAGRAGAPERPPLIVLAGGPTTPSSWPACAYSRRRRSGW